MKCGVGIRRPRERTAVAERPLERGLGHIIMTPRKGKELDHAEGGIDSRNKSRADCDS